MAVYRIVAPGRFVGASTDTKPARANESQVVAGATFYEYDTGNMFITYDGTTWVIKHEEGLGNQKVVTGSSSGAGLAAYAANDIIFNSTAVGTCIAFSAVAKENGGEGYITKANIHIGTSNLTPRLTMIVYNATPTAGTLSDNTANLHPHLNDLAKVVGQIDWLALENLGSGVSHQQAVPGGYGGLPLQFTCASGADDLFGVLVTRDAVTIGTNQVIRVDLTTDC